MPQCGSTYAEVFRVLVHVKVFAKLGVGALFGDRTVLFVQAARRRCDSLLLYVLHFIEEMGQITAQISL